MQIPKSKNVEKKVYLHFPIEEKTHILSIGK